MSGEAEKIHKVFETIKHGTWNELTFQHGLFRPSVSGGVTIMTQPHGLSWSLRSERGANEGLYFSSLGSICSSMLPFIEAPLDC